MMNFKQASDPGSPLQGAFTTTHLRSITYGPGKIKDLYKVIEDVLAQDDQHKDVKPKALVLTGKSLAKTPVIPQIEDILKEKDAFGATFTDMKQHSPIADIEAALDIIVKNDINILIGVGGGSPIDACKTLSYFHNERKGTFIPQVAIPTTLSAAEFTSLAGHTNKEGNKTGVFAEQISPKAIILDAEAAQYTPLKLWLSTGIRALDHALETLYNPLAQYPIQQMALIAIRDLFTYLPQCTEKVDEIGLVVRGKLQVAAWMSLYPRKHGNALGPSHALGHALGATYSIPHGYCSVLTLAGTVRAMTENLPEGPSLDILADTFSFLPASFVRDHVSLSPNPEQDSPTRNACLAVAVAVEKLIAVLDLESDLKSYNVPEGDLDRVAAMAYKAVSGSPGWKDICPSQEDLVKYVLRPAYSKA